MVKTASLLIIGNEILSGRTEDQNLNYIAKGLSEIGVKFKEARVVADIENEIIDAVNDLRKKYDYVFTTGGIGPTHDDITTSTIAKTFGVEVIKNPDAMSRLEKAYEGRKMNQSSIKMAYLPEGASLIDNPVSGAPGFYIENVYVMAGIPNIMQAMFDSVKFQIKGGKPIKSLELSGYVTESKIANDLSQLQNEYPTIDVGSYPFVKNAKFGTSIVLRSSDEELLNEAFSKLEILFQKWEENQNN
ncbi:molybdopterin-binding protein [Rickettsiales bacterium]|nr:molybdopterin-binding protein [Rickettsiales bacterium]